MCHMQLWPWTVCTSIRANIFDCVSIIQIPHYLTNKLLPEVAMHLLATLMHEVV